MSGVLPVTHFVIKVYGCFASISLMTWVLRNALCLIHLQPFQLHSARNRIKATSRRLLSPLCVLCELCVRSSSHKTVSRKARKVRKERPQNKAPKISEPNRPRAMRLAQIDAQTNTNLRDIRGIRDIRDFPDTRDFRETRGLRAYELAGATFSDTSGSLAGEFSSAFTLSASSTNFFCSSSWIAYDPVAGDADGVRPT